MFSIIEKDLHRLCKRCTKRYLHPVYYDRKLISSTKPLEPSSLPDLDTQRRLLDQIASDLKLKSKDDFYSISSQDFEKHGAGPLLKHYKHPLNLLSAIYPNHNWLPWKFPKCPKNFWNDLDNQKFFLESIAPNLRVQNLSDWYQVTKQDLLNVGAGSLLIKKYNTSPFLMLSTIYPQFEWLPWKFSHCPKNFWDDVGNQKKFLDWVAKELNFKEKSDFYKLTTEEIIKFGGGGLLMGRKHRGSPISLLSTVFPEYEWLPWRFSRCPPNFWDDIENQKRFLEWAAKEWNIKEMSDWYKVKDADFEPYGILLKKYSSSPALLLATVYPEYNWLPWKFERCPQGYWDDPGNLIKFFEWAGPQLNIKTLSDWNNVARKLLVTMGGTFLHSKSLAEALSFAYNTPQTVKEKSLSYKKAQAMLKSMLQTMFSNEEFVEEYKHPDIVSPAGYPLEFDYFYPKLDMAVEYQGHQHYKKTGQFSRKEGLEESKQRDVTKATMCKEKGITLIEVPFWWDQKYESLAATVYSLRPELFNEPQTGKPIPVSEPTKDQQQKAKTEEKVKSTVMTATVWEASQNPKGWFMTEKFDGVRLYWNGSSFYTRHGKRVKVPESLTTFMPDVALDGELWTQYGLFQESVSLTGRTDEDKWKKAIYWVFDVPHVAHKSYEERMEYLQIMQDEGRFPSFVKIIPVVVCEGKEHLQKYFKEVVAKGGEGVMLREPGSLYKAGRSTSLRKYKEFFDTEVKVLKSNYPHGFNCLQPNGRNVFVNITENVEEAKNIREGSIITVKHLGTNIYGTLQYPKFYRERTDVSWQDLINQI